MVYYIEFSEQSLHEYRNNLNWKGDGTESNPIIIESLEGLNQYLRFKDIKSHIIIRNVELCEFKVQSCQNFSIENCTVYYLSINYSRNIKVEKSTIVNIHIKFSRACTVRNNNFHNDSYFTNDTLERKGEESFSVGIGFDIFFCAVMLFFILLFLAIGLMLEIIIITIIIFSVLSLLILITKLKLKRMQSSIKKLPPNIIEFNKLTNLEELETKYSEIYDI